MDKRNESLRLNEQNLASYKYDCYSGSQISLYIGSIWVDDAVAIAFTLSDPKTPVYGYASKYYSLVAQGNRVIQGQLTVAYTEDGYFSAIINRVRDEQVFYGGEGVLGSQAIGQSPLAITEAGEQLSSASGGWGDGGGNQVLERIRNVDAEYAKTKAIQNPTQEQKDYKLALEKERESLIKMSDTGNKYTRATLQQRMTDVTGVSSYEDALEGMEDQALDPNYRGRFVTKNPWLVVEGFRGAKKMRRPVEHDLVMSKTNEKVPYETIGDGFDIILGYGDLGSGAAEHTVKVLRDVHIVSEGQVIEANGNPIFEVYQFFARDIAPIEDLTTVESGEEALGGPAVANVDTPKAPTAEKSPIVKVASAGSGLTPSGTPTKELANVATVPPPPEKEASKAVPKVQAQRVIKATKPLKISDYIRALGVPPDSPSWAYPAPLSLGEADVAPPTLVAPPELAEAMPETWAKTKAQYAALCAQADAWSEYGYMITTQLWRQDGSIELIGQTVVGSRPKKISAVEATISYTDTATVPSTTTTIVWTYYPTESDVVSPANFLNAPIYLKPAPLAVVRTTTDAPVDYSVWPTSTDVRDWTASISNPERKSLKQILTAVPLAPDIHIKDIKYVVKAQVQHADGTTTHVDLIPQKQFRPII